MGPARGGNGSRHLAVLGAAALLTAAGCGAAGPASNGGGGATTPTASTAPHTAAPPAGVAAVAVQASGWVLHASVKGGELALVLHSTGGGRIPGFCGGPGFSVAFLDAQGNAVTTPPQATPQYCIGASSTTAGYDFTVPQSAGRYRVKVAVRGRAGALPLQLTLVRSQGGELGLAG